MQGRTSGAGDGGEGGGVMEEKIGRLRIAAEEFESALSNVGHPGVIVDVHTIDITSIEDQHPKAVYVVQVHIERRERVYP